MSTEPKIYSFALIFCASRLIASSSISIMHLKWLKCLAGLSGEKIVHYTIALLLYEYEMIRARAHGDIYWYLLKCGDAMCYVGSHERMSLDRVNSGSIYSSCKPTTRSRCLVVLRLRCDRRVGIFSCASVHDSFLFLHLQSARSSAIRERIKILITRGANVKDDHRERDLYKLQS